jgi:hypothetical protein
MQFGYYDSAPSEAERNRIHEEWRQRWIEEGLPWDRGNSTPPPGWDPIKQLRQLSDFKKEPDDSERVIICMHVLDVRKILSEWPRKGIILETFVRFINSLGHLLLVYQAELDEDQRHVVPSAYEEFVQLGRVRKEELIELFIEALKDKIRSYKKALAWCLKHPAEVPDYPLLADRDDLEFLFFFIDDLRIVPEKELEDYRSKIRALDHKLKDLLTKAYADFERVREHLVDRGRTYPARFWWYHVNQ